MQVETKWFGTVDIEDEKILTFEKGIIGFEDFKKYTILFDSDDGNDAAIMNIFPEYDPVVEDEIIKNLGSDIQNANLLVLCTLTVPSDLTKMTCNLKAPVIINADTLKGVQLIADNDDYQVRYPIYDILNAAKEGK